MKLLSEKTKALWAKKHNENGRSLWLPLTVHLMDAKNVINYLFNHWLNDKQRLFLRRGLNKGELVSEEEIQKLVKFLGYIHDIGKATPIFQVKKSYSFNRDDDLDYALLENLLRQGFVDLDSEIFEDTNKNPHALAGEVLLNKYGVSDSIGAIIGGHHGKPAHKAPIKNIAEYTKHYWQSDGIDEEKMSRWQQVQKGLLAEGLKQAGYQDITELPKKIKKPQAILLEGLLIMADWLASSEYLDNAHQQPLFPLILLEEGIDDLDLQERFQNAMITWGLNDQWQAPKVEDGLALYQKRWHFDHPRLVQAKMTEAIGNLSEPGIVIIEAPMGIGKTEISLAAAEQLAGQTGQTGVFIGLPTQATTNAMFARVKEWVTSLAKEEGANFDIRLQHGKAIFNKEYRELPHASDISADEWGDDTLNVTGQVVINDWFSGKKSILTDFMVATIDHLLLMGLKQKHLFLRHLGFSSKVVIIDEVHAYSAYMDSYLEKVIKWLGAYEVPLVVLSATLPKKKRAELVNVYLEGRYKQKKPLSAPANWQEEQAYPLLTMTDGANIIQVTDFEEEMGKDIKVVRKDLADENLIREIDSLLATGGIAGLIVNTVKRAQELAQLALKLCPDLPIEVLHSRFLAPKRAEQEENIQAAIGKNAHRPERLLVIGTQVLEQSLDIDFDILYTDIAPMDLILQRMGRLHRHQIKRPKQFLQPTINILGIKDYGNYDDNNLAIYGLYLLQKTDYYLPDKINLPNDISPLVQKVYDDIDDSEEMDQFRDAYEEFKDEIVGSKRKAQSKFQIGNPTGKNIHGWLDYDMKVPSEERANAAVRDIEETVEVILTKAAPGGDELISGEKLAEVSSEKIAEQVIRLPHAVSYNINDLISELEKRTATKYPAWQSDSWLHGCLALRLDENQQTHLLNYLLTYDSKLGLIHEKEVTD